MFVIFAFVSAIVDFYCPSENLVIELDGEPHFPEEGIKHDEARTKFINDLEIRVVRFENRKVFENPGRVLEEIKKYFNHPNHPGSA